MGNYQPQLIWQGNPIGIFNNPRPDMAYLEGLWLPNHTEAAAAFGTLAKRLNPQAVLRDLNQEVKILLQSEDTTTYAIVISLTAENDLFVRRIIGR